ncbi:MAG: addiction module protein [Desulfurivibrionaceae bacterium]|nr:addiction module protein [Desulfurivibrionaceae bacterium]
MKQQERIDFFNPDSLESFHLEVINMVMASDKMIEDALSLPAEARLALIDTLLQSLNLPFDKEIERAWASESERRVTELKEGKTEMIPGEEVFARIQAKHFK